MLYKCSKVVDQWPGTPYDQRSKKMWGTHKDNILFPRSVSGRYFINLSIFSRNFFSLMISVEISEVEIQSDSWHWQFGATRKYWKRRQSIWKRRQSIVENIAIREVRSVGCLWSEVWTLENFKIHVIFFLVVVSLLEINEYIKQGDLFASVKFVDPPKLISRRSMKRNYSEALLHVLKLKFFQKMSYFLLES